MRFFLFICSSLFIFGQSNLSDLSGPFTPDNTQVGSVPNGRGGGGVTYFSDRGAFIAAFPGISCDSLNDLTSSFVEAAPAPWNSATSNTIVAPGEIIPGINFLDDPLNDAGGGDPNGLVVVAPGAFGNTNTIVASNTFVDRTVIDFDSPVDVFGADFHSLAGASTVTVTILDASDGVIDSTTIPATNAGVFMGIQSTTPIGSIVLEDLTGANVEGISEYCFGSATPPIPTMSEWGLIFFVTILMAASIVFMRKRRNA